MERHQDIVCIDGKQFLRIAACDACDKDSIYGLRFRCVECPDFDLCEECYRIGSHEHKMRSIDPVEYIAPMAGYIPSGASGLTIL